MKVARAHRYSITALERKIRLDECIEYKDIYAESIFERWEKE